MDPIKDDHAEDTETADEVEADAEAPSEPGEVGSDEVVGG